MPHSSCSLRPIARLLPTAVPTLALLLGGLAGCGSPLPDGSLGSLRSSVVTRTDDPDCPPGIPCDDTPAAYAISDPMTGSYGNYDLADRARDGLDIRYIVIHTTEGSWDGTIAVFQNSSYHASAHYLVRSRDGHLAKFVSPSHVAWHAGNWYFNMHSVGIEHEAASSEGHRWFTDELYETSAALVRFLAKRYNVPLDREHIIGHDEIPGLSVARTPGMHWDPGPYWDWDRFMHMVRERPTGPIGERDDDGSTTMGPVRIHPDYWDNKPTVSYCYGATGADCRDAPSAASNFLYLRQAPSATAPLITNSYLGSPPERMNNWANKAGAGRLYYRLDRSGDWDAIYFSGQVGWFYNPGRRYTRIPLLGSGQVVITPKAGVPGVAIYGGGYPGAGAFKPPTTPVSTEKVYDLPAGQRYIAYGPVSGDYYWAKVWAATLPMSSHQVVKDTTPFYVVSWNHRLALVRAEDVVTVRMTPGHGGGSDRRTAPGGSDAPEHPEAGEAVESLPAMPLYDLKGME